MDNFKINKIEIRYERRGCTKSRRMDGLCHVKVLPWLSLAQATEGSYDIRLGRESEPIYSTGEGGMFIAPSNTLQTITHRANKDSSLMGIRWIFLDVVINGEYRPDRLFDFPIVVPKETAKRISLLLDELFLCEDICDCYSVYYRIIKLLLSLGTPKTRRESNPMSAVSDYIYENYDKEITVKDLADIAYMSESNLHAVFKRQFGLPPLSYINHYRLSLAAERLLLSDAHVCDIANSVGFSDPLYFSKMFKKQYSLSPKEYRRMNRV